VNEGTVAAVLSLDIDMARPPAGAAFGSDTTATVDVPPTTVDASEICDGPNGRIVNDAVGEFPPRVAVSVTGMVVDTGTVGIWKEADEAPLGTVIVAGKTAAVLLLDNPTVIP